MNKEIIEDLLRFSAKINLLSKQAKDFGTGDLLYASEIHTIAMIANNQGINLTQLAEKMGVSKSAVSKFVKKTLTKGYIIKSKSVHNQKEVIFNITKKGEIAFQNHEKYSKSHFYNLHQIIAKLPDEHKKIISGFIEEMNKGLIDI